MKLGIIADDFTGANDVGLQLIKYGIKVECLRKIPEILPNYFVYSTETRNSTKEEAKKNLNKVFKNLQQCNFDKIYKKIDSTLRGNIWIEVEAFLNTIKEEEKLIIVLPFPKNKRIVKEGKLWVNGVELKETEFAFDPFWNLKSSDILDYFQGDLIKLEEIRSDNFYNLLSEKESNILIFEGETEKDLEIISKNIVKKNWDKYIVGSAGLMEYLLYDWGFFKEKILIVAGSCNAITINQVNNFINKYNPKVYDYYIDEDRLDISEGSDVFLLRSIRTEKEKRSEKENVKNLIAKEVKKICDSEKITKIVLSGGDITKAFMEIEKIEKLELLSEIETGIAFGINKNWRIVTKSGGYGSEEIYEKICNFLKNYR